MNPLCRSYLISELPDPLYPRYQLAAGGDVQRAALSDFEQVLRCISNLPADSAAVSLVFVFTPRDDPAAAQSRLSIYVLARAKDEGTADVLALLLERGPWGRFYDLRPVAEPVLPWEQMMAACHVVRREDAVEPTQPPEVNDRIPSIYYTIRPFEPSETKDSLLLDRVLAELCEPAVVLITVSPTDVAAELAEHTRYLGQMESVNRSWDRDEEDEGDNTNYLGTGQGWRAGSRSALRPMRREDPLADDILRRQRRFHETLILPNLSFQIVAMAGTAPVARLLASVVAESAFTDSTYRLFPRNSDTVNPIAAAHWPVPFSTLAPLCGTARANRYAGLARLAQVASVDELIGAFRLPIASCESPCCIRKNTDPPREDQVDLIVLGHDRGLPRGIRVGQLVKHAFIGGVPGAGKSRGGQNLVNQLTNRGIPSLIIEPVKTEYRQLMQFKDVDDEALRRTAVELRIYTPGNEAISPFRFNPMWVRPGISRDEHMENLMQCFYAAMPMSGPLPALLREGLELVYDDHPDPENPPVLADLFYATEKVLAEKGYSAETNSDLRAALEVRLGLLTRGSIGKVFQCPKNVPDIDELLTHPTVIELDYLPRDPACVLTLFLLTAAREYLKTASPTDDPVRSVTLVEEAHRLVGRSTKATPSEDNANSSNYASDFVVNMLAETRALKGSVVILDQLPSAVAPEVIKNTSTKLGFRLVANDDREELGGTMLFTQVEHEEIARLPVGEAYLYTEGFHGPRHIQAVNPFKGLDPAKPLLHEAIIPYLCDEEWYKRAAADRQDAELGLLCREMDSFEAKRLNIIKRTAELLAEYPRILARHTSRGRLIGLKRLLETSRSLRHELATSLDIFSRRRYRPLIGLNTTEDTAKELREHLVRRFDSTITLDIRSYLTKLDERIGQWQTQLYEQEGV